MRLRILLSQAALLAVVALVAWLLGVPPATLAALVAVGAGVALLGSELLLRTLQRPIHELTRGAQRVAAGNFEPVARHTARDELAGLADAFNQMVASLHSRDQQFQALNDELSRRLRELNALYEVSRGVNSSMDVQEVLRLILNETVKAFPTAQKGLIHLVDEGGQRLIPIALSDTRGPLDHSMGMALDRGIAGRVVRERHPLTLSDTASHPDFLDLGSNVRSLMVVPLEVGGTVLGALSLDSSERNAFTPDMQAVFRALADRAAIAIENARLIAELQAKTQALEVANEELSRASQLKSEFLANMSHELRTPLNAILGFSEILVDQTFGPLNERQLRYVGNINASGQHLLDLINDILDLSKIEAGRMELVLEPFRLCSALHEVYTIIEPLATKKALSVQIDCTDEPARILADRLRFKQILYNVVSNAVKFTPEGGSIRIRATSQPPINGRDGHTLTIEVTDTGIGIPEEHLGQIFDVFHRLDLSYRRDSEGTGLGLALVRRFVELHGGTVRVTSEVDVGSTFTITLPQPQPVPATTEGAEGTQ